MLVTYIRAGRLGNNLIQYFVTKIFQHLLNSRFNTPYTYVFNSPDTIKKYENHTVIDHTVFDAIIKSIEEPNSLDLLKNRHLIFNGFFQNANFLIKHRQFILSIFNQENEDRVNEQYRVSDISRFINKFTPVTTNSDLTVHLRLDDYGDKITPSETIIDILKKIGKNYTNIYVVVDKIKTLSEIQYINKICYSHKVIIITNSLLNDFSFLYHSQNIVISNSTFAWTAAYLGKADYNWMPTSWYSADSHLSQLNDKTIVYQ